MRLTGSRSLGTQAQPHPLACRLCLKGRKGLNVSGGPVLGLWQFPLPGLQQPRLVRNVCNAELGGRAAGGSGGLGRPAGQAPQLSNRPGPAGSWNSCLSSLFPPCQLPLPAACRAHGLYSGACSERWRDRGPESLEAGVKGRGFQGEREGVQSAQPPWPRERRAFAQGPSGRRHHRTGPHPGFRHFGSDGTRLHLDTAWRALCHSDGQL